VCLRPPTDEVCGPLINYNSLAQSLSDDGFFLLGISEAEVQHYDMDTVLKSVFEDKHGLELQAAQVIQCRTEDIIRTQQDSSKAISPSHLNYLLVTLGKSKQKFL
jgi:hypothetical protein